MHGITDTQGTRVNEQQHVEPAGSVISNWQAGDILIGRLQCQPKIQMSVFLQFRSVSVTWFWVGRRAGAEPPA